MTEIFEFAAAVLRYALPVFLAALGVLLNQKAGIVNIGAEGFMLVGCLAGITGAGLFSGFIPGFFTAVFITAAFGAVFGWMIYTLKVNDIVLGIAFNILASGLCTLMYRSGIGAVRYSGRSFSMVGMFMFAVIAAAAIHMFLYHTFPGLKFRTVGEYETLANTMGLGGKSLRCLGFVCGCGLIGLGGACLSLGELNMFVEDMTDGRGYIALAAVCFGRFTPAGALIAVLIFGCGEAVQYRLQAMGCPMPHQFALMMPYILTILGLVAAYKKKQEN